MQKINALKVLRLLLLVCRSRAKQKFRAKRSGRSKVCYLISLSVYFVKFLIQLIDFAYQQRIGLNIDDEIKKKIATCCSG